MHPEKRDPWLTPDEQTKYRSGVGMLLYLVQHSRPDISNAARDLSKVFDGATAGQWKEWIRAIKYGIATNLFAIKRKPSLYIDNKFHMEAYTDSEFAGDKETTASVYGFVTFFCGAPISWKSKSNKSATWYLPLKQNISLHLKLRKK
jgi:hypothetical protein